CNPQSWIQREIAEVKSKVFEPLPDRHQSDIAARRLEAPPQRIKQHAQARVTRSQPDQQSFCLLRKEMDVVAVCAIDQYREPKQNQIGGQVRIASRQRGSS